MSLDAYEYVGVAVPGALPTLAATLLYPGIGELLGADGVKLGGLGLFVIAAFVVGHIVAAFGNLVETIEDRLGVGLRRMPFSRGRGGVAEAQWDRFLSACERRLGVQADGISEATWFGIRKEITASLGDGANGRIEALNRTYGLCRGIAVSCVVTGLWTLLIEGREATGVVVMLLCAAAIVYVRKRRFGRLYLQEVVAQFLASDVARHASND